MTSGTGWWYSHEAVGVPQGEAVMEVLGGWVVVAVAVAVGVVEGMAGVGDVQPLLVLLVGEAYW